MCKFIQVGYNPQKNIFYNIQYITQIHSTYRKYAKYLQDDFALADKDIYSFLKNCPFFWVILNPKNEYMGFVFLDNLCGNEDILYSAELTTCFEKQAWGEYTKYCAKIFLKKCFDELGLYKIKVQVYPDNYRTAALIKSSGFKYECTLKNETLRCGKPQDIDVYSLYRDYYYKTR